MKPIRLVCVFILMLIMVSCKSNQEKAEVLIKKDMFTLLACFDLVPNNDLICQ